MRKIKVLCLHGYRQTADSFYEKTGAFRKHLKKKADFAFLTAPNNIPEDDGSAWWFSHPDLKFSAKDVSNHSIGFQTSVDALKVFISDEGPFDGIFAFSQGAAFALILQLMLENHLLGMTEAILPMFHPPATVYAHEGGHFIPANADAKLAYDSLLSPLLME
ncbi:unnamed protein product [Dicrocoelium dendriticum]|nr:unnamed protein product [Dicrocoelium dendriticum]